MINADYESPEVQRMIQEAQEAMTEELFEEAIRTRANVEPDDLTTLLDLLALGITNGAWRNSCVENWHADGRLSDGDMMRINSHTTDGIRRRLTGWTTEYGITSAEASALAQVDAEDAGVLATRLFRWLTNPRRKLPTGITLGELARTGEDLAEYQDHADRTLGGFVGLMEDKGVRFGLLRTASHGALSCARWWAHPAWLDLVERFVSALDEPTHSHWGPDGQWRTKLGVEPVSVQDRHTLRATLLAAPWKLDGDAAEWITNAGIGYMSPTITPPSAPTSN
ncbi:hypothetical protein OG948_05855 [Embleya sp. NBC_00888]|uniref:hypothetical protein n=1 Tax=Embleya sp. NBC_00888 TaxID=2975960 RepID=UPI0038691FC7|nr:hypothetical protein OG948_05855 [Embleya sp. NBC_00888]